MSIKVDSVVDAALEEGCRTLQRVKADLRIIKQRLQNDPNLFDPPIDPLEGLHLGNSSSNIHNISTVSAPGLNNISSLFTTIPNNTSTLVVEDHPRDGKPNDDHDARPNDDEVVERGTGLDGAMLLEAAVTNDFPPCLSGTIPEPIRELLNNSTMTRYANLLSETEEWEARIHALREERAKEERDFEEQRGELQVRMGVEIADICDTIARGEIKIADAMRTEEVKKQEREKLEIRQAEKRAKQAVKNCTKVTNRSNSSGGKIFPQHDDPSKKKKCKGSKLEKQNALLQKTDIELDTFQPRQEEILLRLRHVVQNKQRELDDTKDMVLRRQICIRSIMDNIRERDVVLYGKGIQMVHATVTKKKDENGYDACPHKDVEKERLIAQGVSAELIADEQFASLESSNPDLAGETTDQTTITATVSEQAIGESVAAAAPEKLAIGRTSAAREKSNLLPNSTNAAGLDLPSEQTAQAMELTQGDEATITLFQCGNFPQRVGILEQMGATMLDKQSEEMQTQIREVDIQLNIAENTQRQIDSNCQFLAKEITTLEACIANHMNWFCSYTKDAESQSLEEGKQEVERLLSLDKRSYDDIMDEIDLRLEEECLRKDLTVDANDYASRDSSKEDNVSNVNVSNAKDVLEMETLKQDITTLLGNPNGPLVNHLQRNKKIDLESLFDDHGVPELSGPLTSISLSKVLKAIPHVGTYDANVGASSGGGPSGSKGRASQPQKETPRNGGRTPPVQQEKEHSGTPSPGGGGVERGKVQAKRESAREENSNRRDRGDDNKFGVSTRRSRFGSDAEKKYSARGGDPNEKFNLKSKLSSARGIRPDSKKQGITPKSNFQPRSRVNHAARAPPPTGTGATNPTSSTTTPQSGNSASQPGNPSGNPISLRKRDARGAVSYIRDEPFARAGIVATRGGRAIAHDSSSPDRTLKQKNLKKITYKNPTAAVIPNGITNIHATMNGNANPAAGPVSKKEKGVPSAPFQANSIHLTAPTDAHSTTQRSTNKATSFPIPVPLPSAFSHDFQSSSRHEFEYEPGKLFHSVHVADNVMNDELLSSVVESDYPPSRLGSFASRATVSGHVPIQNQVTRGFSGVQGLISQQVSVGHERDTTQQGIPEIHSQSGGQPSSKLPPGGQPSRTQSTPLLDATKNQDHLLGDAYPAVAERLPSFGSEIAQPSYNYEGGFGGDPLNGPFGPASIRNENQKIGSLSVRSDPLTPTASVPAGSPLAVSIASGSIPSASPMAGMPSPLGIVPSPLGGPLGSSPKMATLDDTAGGSAGAVLGGSNPLLGAATVCTVQSSSSGATNLVGALGPAASLESTTPLRTAEIAAKSERFSGAGLPKSSSSISDRVGGGFPERKSQSQILNESDSLRSMTTRMTDTRNTETRFTTDPGITNGSTTTKADELVGQHAVLSGFPVQQGLGGFLVPQSQSGGFPNPQSQTGGFPISQSQSRSFPVPQSGGFLVPQSVVSQSDPMSPLSAPQSRPLVASPRASADSYLSHSASSGGGVIRNGSQGLSQQTFSLDGQSSDERTSVPRATSPVFGGAKRCLPEFGTTNDSPVAGFGTANEARFGNNEE